MCKKSSQKAPFTSCHTKKIKHVLGPRDGTSMLFPRLPNVCMTANVVLHLYSEFCPNWFRFRRVIADKAFDGATKCTHYWLSVKACNKKKVYSTRDKGDDCSVE